MLRSAIAGLFLLSLAAAPGAAAPQIVGLVATASPIPMQCEDGRCSALLSAFCLQEKRLPPDFETAYDPAAAGVVTLLVTAQDGRTHRLDAAGLVEFRSGYGFTAMRAELALDRVAGLAPRALAVAVAPLAAMLPQPVAGDADPLTAEEIALATGPWRLAAAAIMEGEGETARALRLTGRLINALPSAGDIAAADRAALWHDLAGPDAPAPARQAFEACGRSVDQSLGYPLRLCLEERHESMQIDNTRAFWRSLGGS